MSACGTALVTGASSGIGAVYADGLAARDYDLILVARDTERLEATAARLRETSNSIVAVLTADLTVTEQLQHVLDRLKQDASITMLVNNAGMSLNGGWLVADDTQIATMIRLNTIAPTLLAKAAANAFLARNAGAIVNIASVLAVAPERFDGAYSGTKAHLINLTLALIARFAGSAVRVQAVLPGATRTEIFERSGKSLADYPAEWLMEPIDLFEAAMLGFERGETITIPSLPDMAQWEAMDAARWAMIPNIQNGQVAARYRSA